MAKAQLNARVSDLTRRQLDELGQRWGTTQTETLTVIIDRMYREEVKAMNSTVLLRHRTSGDVFAARLNDKGEVTQSVGPLHYADYAAALAGEGDANMTTEDNDWLNENDFVQWTPPQPE